MDRRRGFVVAAGAILILAFTLLVVRPGVQRGGVQEIVIIGAIFAFILLFERFLRTR